MRVLYFCRTLANFTKANDNPIALAGLVAMYLNETKSIEDLQCVRQIKNYKSNVMSFP